MASIQKRRLQDGSIRWIAQINKKGYKRLNITKNTKAAVEKAARDIEVAMDNNTWDEFASDEQKFGNTALEYFIKLYLKEITPHKKGGTSTIYNETSVLNLILNSPLAKMDIYRIKTGHIIGIRNQWRDKGNKATTINRKLTTLHDVFKHIRTTWKHEGLTNPVQGSKLKVPTGTAERNRALSDAELLTLRKELDDCKSPYMRWMFDLALETAARRRELLENSWSNVNLPDGWICIPATLSKTRKERLIPLTPKAHSILKDIQAYQERQFLKSSRLIPITIKSFEEAWKKTMLRSKIKNFQFRDTRHMAATMLSNIYPKMQDLAKITGHDKLDTLLIYYEETIENQVRSMQQHFNK
ncbi:MAG: site-specific integrase [Mariprofundaceae bacterium]|nr:site-specific integrase [Mariprofundaceae bacterium]